MSRYIQEEVGEKTNEIKYVKPLLEGLDIEGGVITADAMHTQKETVYGVTSLKRGEASAEKLLMLHREHWGIENKVHYVRDTAYDEDRCRIRVKNGPRVMASIRNLVIGIFRLLGSRYVASAIRYYCFNPDLEETLAILGV